MARKHTYHRENCDCFIREIIVDVYERTIVLNGQHAFEWSITIYTRERIVQTIYPNGKEARKEFYKYKRKKTIITILLCFTQYITTKRYTNSLFEI